MRSSSALQKIWIEDGNRIAAYYHDRIIAKGGVTAASLDWRNEESHLQFLKHSLGHVDLNTVNTVFDVGCGDGRCAKLISSIKGSPVKYTGLDVVKEFVDYGRMQYPLAKLMVGNFIDPTISLNKTYDLVLNLGGLNSRVRHYGEYISANIEKMVRISDKYVVFNVIIDPDPAFFPKGSQFSIGHIGFTSKQAVINICNRIFLTTKRPYLSEFRTIFPGSTDMFVTFLPHETC